MAAIATKPPVDADRDLIDVIRERLADGCLTHADLRKGLKGLVRITPSLFQRWCTRGSRGVVCRSWFIGSRRTTTREAFVAFLRELNARDDAATTQAVRSPSTRARAHSRAEAELDAAGI